MREDLLKSAKKKYFSCQILVETVNLRGALSFLIESKGMEVEKTMIIEEFDPKPSLRWKLSREKAEEFGL